MSSKSIRCLIWNVRFPGRVIWRRGTGDGAVDHWAQGGNEGDGGQVRASDQGREGGDPRRALLPHGLDAATAAGPSRRRARASSSGEARPVVYDPEVVDALRKVWIVMGGPCGKRLALFLSEIVTALERHCELSLHPEVRAKLIAISRRRSSGCLPPTASDYSSKAEAGPSWEACSKPQIPIRTFAEWDETGPAFCETDLVAHDGGNSLGEFCQSLNLTDVATGWTEMRAVKNRAQRWVFEALIDFEQYPPWGPGHEALRGGSDPLQRLLVSDEISK